MRHQQKGDTLTVFLSGELDHHCAAQIKDEIDALLAGGDVQRLVLDMSALRFMDSSGIGMILGRYNKMAKRGGTLALKRASPQVKRIINLAGIDQLVERM